MPKKTPAVTIAKIQEDGRAHKRVPAIATDNNVSEGTVLRYLTEAGIGAIYGTDSTAEEAEQAAPREPGQPSEAEEPTPTIYPPAGVVPPRRRAEVRTDFSQPADELTDVARALQARQTIEQLATPRESALDVALKLDDLSKRQREPLEAELEQRDARIIELERMVGELKRRDERGEMLLNIERLRGEQEVGRTQLQISIQELAHSNAIDLKKLEMGSEQIQNTKFLLDHGPEAMEKLGLAGEKLAEGLLRGVMKMGISPGQLVGRIRGAVDTTMEMVDPQVGGAIGEPVKLTELRRKVIRAKRVGPGAEILPRSDAELERIAEALEEYADGEDDAEEEDVGHDRNREARLANEVGILRRQLAEYEGRPKPRAGSSVEQVHQPRVVAASRPTKPVLKDQEVEHNVVDTEKE